MKRISLLASTALLLVPPVAALATPPCSSGFWNPVPDMPAPRGQTCATVVDGKIYVFGDYNYSPEHDWCGVFDPQANAWTELAPMLTGRGMAAAAAVEGVVYVAGGNRSFSNWWVRTFEAYDTESGTWSSLPEIPGTKRGLLSAAAVDGKVYVMGGTNSYVLPTFDNNSIYDSADGTWSNGPALPRYRSHHASAVLDGKIYVIGGQYRMSHGDDLPVLAVDVFDPATNTWATPTSLPTPRWGLQAVALNGRIYAIGGRIMSPDGTSTDYVDLVEEYDPVLDCWRTVTSLPATHGMGSAAVVDRRIYLLGGYETDAGGNPNTIPTCRVGYPTAEPSTEFADLNSDGQVDPEDLAIMRAIVGPCHAADLDKSGSVGFDDLLEIIQQWGPCP